MSPPVNIGDKDTLIFFMKSELKVTKISLDCWHKSQMEMGHSLHVRIPLWSDPLF